jgi:hypothetical protein
LAVSRKEPVARVLMRTPSYVHQLTGQLRSNCLVAKTAYTQPLMDALGMVFGVVWANKPEFLDDVQRNPSATIGLTYKLVEGLDR